MSGTGENRSALDDLTDVWDEAERGGGAVEGGGDAGSVNAGNSVTAARDAGASEGVENQNIDAGEKSGDKGTTRDGRPRDEQGRFAKKDDAEADPKATSPDKGTAADPKASEGQAGAADPKAADGLPTNWSDVSADDWGKVPASVRAKIAARESQVAQGFQAYNQVLAPVMQAAKVRGIDWREGLQRLVAAEERLMSDPHGALIWLAKARNINLDDLAEMAAGTMPLPGGQGQHGNNGNGQPQGDPALVSQVNDLQSQLQKIQLQPLLTTINEFRNSPEGELFDEVKQEINACLPAVKARNPGADPKVLLRLAYTAAIAMRPDIGAKVAANAKARADQEARAKAEQERMRRGGAAASVHLSGSSGSSGGGGKLNSDSVVDVLSATWDEVAARL